MNDEQHRLYKVGLLVLGKWFWYKLLSFVLLFLKTFFFFDKVIKRLFDIVSDFVLVQL
jgi:hypothetical protein